MKHIAILLVIAWLSACGSSTGWRVEFGVSPINSLHNEVGQQPARLRPAKY